MTRKTQIRTTIRSDIGALLGLVGRAAGQGGLLVGQLKDFADDVVRDRSLTAVKCD
jgi:hypothetical protein